LTEPVSISNTAKRIGCDVAEVERMLASGRLKRHGSGVAGWSILSAVRERKESASAATPESKPGSRPLKPWDITQPVSIANAAIKLSVSEHDVQVMLAEGRLDGHGDGVDFHSLLAAQRMARAGSLKTSEQSPMATAPKRQQSSMPDSPDNYMTIGRQEELRRNIASQASSGAARGSSSRSRETDWGAKYASGYEPDRDKIRSLGVSYPRD